MAETFAPLEFQADTSQAVDQIDGLAEALAKASDALSGADDRFADSIQKTQEYVASLNARVESQRRETETLKERDPIARAVIEEVERETAAHRLANSEMQRAVEVNRQFTGQLAALQAAHQRNEAQQRRVAEVSKQLGVSEMEAKKALAAYNQELNQHEAALKKAEGEERKFASAMDSAAKQIGQAAKTDFQQGKQAVRMLGLEVQNATGVHIPFLNVLRSVPLAMAGPAIAVTALAGGVMYLHSKFKEAAEVVKESDVWYGKVGESLEKLKEKHVKLSPAQEAILKQAQQVKEQKQNEEWEKIGNAMDWTSARADMLRTAQEWLGNAIDFANRHAHDFIGGLMKLLVPITSVYEGYRKLMHLMGTEVPPLMDLATDAWKKLGDAAKGADEEFKKLQMQQQNMTALEDAKKEAEAYTKAQEAAKKYADEKQRILHKLRELEVDAIENPYDRERVKLLERLDEWREFTAKHKELAAQRAEGEKLIMDNIARIDKMQRDKAEAERQSYVDRIVRMEAKGEEDTLRSHLDSIAAQMGAYKKLLNGKKEDEELYYRAQRAMQAEQISYLNRELSQNEQKISNMRKKSATDTENAIIETANKSHNKQVHMVVQAVQIMRKVEAAHAAWKQMQKLQERSDTIRAEITKVQATATASSASIAAEAPNAATKSYSSLAAIPFVGPILGFAAAAAALLYANQQKSAADSAGAQVSGIAHSGMDAVPHVGSYILKEKEMVLDPWAGETGRALVNMAKRGATPQQMGGGTTEIHMHAPVYSTQGALQELQRDMHRVNARRNGPGA